MGSGGVPWWRPSWLDSRHQDDGETDDILSAGRFPTRHIDLPEIGAVRHTPTSTSNDDHRRPLGTYAIISVHILVSVVLMVTATFEFSDLNFGQPSSGVPNWIGAQQSYVYSGQYWRLFTGIWLHSGLILLVLTIVALYRAGGDIELEHGPKVFLMLYVLSALGGSMTSVIYSYPSERGACGSAGIFGLFGSDLAYFVHNYYQLGGQRWRYIIVSILLSFAGFVLGLHPIMNNYAHIGGFVTGLIVSMAMLAQFQTVRGQPWLRYNRRSLAVCCLCTFLSIALFAALISGLILRLSAPCSWCHHANCIPTPWWTCPEPDVL